MTKTPIMPIPGRKGKILSILAEKPNATPKELSEALEISITNAYMLLSELRKKKLITKKVSYSLNVALINQKQKKA